MQLVTVVVLATLLVGCGSRTAADRPALGSTESAATVPATSAALSATPTPYAGPLHVDVNDENDPDPRIRGGAAVAALECTGSPNSYGRMGGHTHPNAAAAFNEFVSNDSNEVPRDGYRIEREEAGRVLYSYDVDGRTKVALIISDRPLEGFESGWHVETEGRCDLAEFPDAVTDALGIQVWTDKDGVRVPTTEIQSRQGQEHCKWESVTFLNLGRPQYIRDPNGAISSAADSLFGGQFRTTFDPAATLPADAKDTGFRLDGKSLWLAANKSAAYVGTRETVERWPAPVKRVGCA